MYRIEVICEKGGAFGQCGTGGWTTDDHTRPMPDDFRQQLAGHGWAEQDGKFYCQRHDPDNQGQMVALGLDYVELAPGVRARWRDAQRQGDTFPIEVQTQYRECHGCVGGVCGGGNGVYEPGTEWGAWHKPDEKGR